MRNPNAGGTADPIVVADDLSGEAGAGRLTVRLIPEGEEISVRLEGELDLETAKAFDRRLADIDEARVTRLLIDLSGVTFMDSTGLQSIVRAHRSAEANGHDLVLRRGSRQVQRLFQLTGMDDRLTFEQG